MKTRRGWLSAAGLALALLSNGVGALAQQTTTVQGAGAQGGGERKRVEVIERERVVVSSDDPVEGLEGGRIRTPSGGTFVFLSTEMSFDGKVVKGAPYSAEAVTETVQTLGDGNRIVNKTSANVYRDSEGRTRRDQTLGTIGPFASAGEPPQTFFINDPVAGVNYILDPRSHTARKLTVRVLNGGSAAGGATIVAAPVRRDAKVKDKEVKEFKELRDRDEDITITLPAPPPAPAAASVAPAPGVPHQTFFYTKTPDNAQKESLGERTIEGVRAEGTRTTVTIPAGEIGNEQPINIVSERWYSPELQVVLMTRHSDPRFGETTYRLTNINRSEPAHSLFEVPSDYTVKEAPAIRTFTRTPRLRDKEKEEKDK